MSAGITDVVELGARLARVSAQRWSMSFAALLAATGAAIATGAAAGAQSLFAIVLVAGLAGLTVVRPDTHLAFGLFIVVAWYWLAAVDDTASPWVLAVALALVVFHTLVALLATTPPTATVDAVSQRRWLVRSIAVAAATVATWGVVALFDRQDLAGSAWLTALALVTALLLAAGLRARVRT